MHQPIDISINENDLKKEVVETPFFNWLIFNSENCTEFVVNLSQYLIGKQYDKNWLKISIFYTFFNEQNSISQMRHIHQCFQLVKKQKINNILYQWQIKYLK